ncbi:MAG: rRNA maturation RNAse YbeY, partial [Clostridia bacterium]|nr:rRNA maturation RNAse YbeY [Clostridia bacterium]
MVELIIENEQNKEAFTNELEAVVRAVCEKVMECEECDFDAQISLTLTDNENIKIINNEFRSIDAPTDVLSFPMLE